jgi:hypothetical protein
MSLPQCHWQTYPDVLPLPENKGSRIKHCTLFRVVCHDGPGLETSFARLGRFWNLNAPMKGCVADRAVMLLAHMKRFAIGVGGLEQLARQKDLRSPVLGG